MIQIGQDLEAILQDLVRFAAFDVHHETDAAGIVFERRVVKTLLGRVARQWGAPSFGVVAH